MSSRHASYTLDCADPPKQHPFPISPVSGRSSFCSRGAWRRPQDLDQGCLTPFLRRRRCPTDGASAPAGEASALETAQRTHPRDNNRPRSLLTDRRQMERVRSGGNLGIDERRFKKPERVKQPRGQKGGRRKGARLSLGAEAERVTIGGPISRFWALPGRPIWAAPFY